MKTLNALALMLICASGMAQNLFPLLSSGDYSGGSGDFTNVVNPQLQMRNPNGYVRVAHLSASSVSAVYNFESGKNVFWGEDNDGGTYFFRGRDVNMGRSLWVNNSATISSDYADNDPNYSWNYNLMVRNNNNANSTFSRLSFVSQSGGFGAISVQKTDTYTGDMYFQVRNGAGFFQTPMIIKSNGSIGIGTTSPAAKLDVRDDTALPQATGSYQLLERISGRGQNYFMRNNWLLRDAGSTTQWWTTRLHDGISIDGSFLTPGVDTRTWWERDPNDNIQSWGHADQTYMTINQGNVGIGTPSPDAKLAVKGQVHAQEVKVDLNGAVAPDYVFEKDYKLTSLEEIKNYIDQNKHLPEIPSAKEMEKNGVQLGEMNMLLLKKIEELTLHVIELKKNSKAEIKLMEKENQELKKRLEILENKK